MAKEVNQRVRGLENEQGLLWDEVRALRDRITRGWGATLRVILRPPGDVSIADGRVVAPENSGQANLGTSLLPFGVVYANSFTNPSGEVVATEIIDQDGGANIKAARSATVSMLLALDGSAKFPASTITLAGISGLSLAGGLQLDDSVAGAGLVVSSKVLAVGAGSGIDVTASTVAVDVSASFTWTGAHTFVGFVLSQNEGTAGYLSYRYSDDASGPYWSSRKARGDIASPAIVGDGDTLWDITAMGHDGAAWASAAGIMIQVDGTPSIDDMPGKILLRTTPAGSDTPQTRVKIRNTGVAEFYNGLTLSGATGVNVVTVPDNALVAVHLVDAGGIEYLRVVSVNAQPIVVFNEGGADVDHRWEASGQPNALFLQGSTGNVGVGTDTPSISAILELLSTTKAFLLTRMSTTQRDALTAVDGMVLYNSTTGEINSREGGSWVTSVYTARQVIAGSGLTGGGALSADVTLNVGAGDGISVAADAIAVDLASPAGLEFSGGDLRIADSIAGDGLSIASKVLAVDSSVVRTTRQVIAGSGLTGGGALSADVTLNIGAGDGIDVVADSIAVDVTDFIDTAYGLTESANNIRINTGATLDFTSGALQVDVAAMFTWSGAHAFLTDVPFSGDIRVASGLYVGGTGVDPPGGAVCYTGELRPFRVSTLYTAYAFVPLTTSLTSTSWDGDAFSDVATSTQLNLSAAFGVPPGIKAVLLRMHARDSAAWGTAGLYFSCGPSSAQWFAASVLPAGGDVLIENTAVVPCDGNGDVWYQINASGASTMDIWLQVWGYFI